MGDKSAIEWTDATWNPMTGCTKVSPGCANCYIERTPPFRMAGRRFVRGMIPIEQHPERLAWPLMWRKSRRVFVNSLSDTFHEDISFESIAEVHSVMAQAEWHQYQVLTKRPARAVAFYEWLETEVGRRALGVMAQVWEWPLPHVWVGVTAENRRMLRERGRSLLSIDAGVRWLSLEPLLEDVTDSLDALLSVSGGAIQWVVCGLESGPRRRPSEVGERQRAWVRGVRDVCAAHGVAFLFKQWGGATAKSGGRLLDGATHDGYPVTDGIVRR